MGNGLLLHKKCMTATMIAASPRVDWNVIQNMSKKQSAILFQNKIGSGAQGTVYGGTRKSTGSPIVVKRVPLYHDNDDDIYSSEEMQNQIEHELFAQKKIVHPYIIKIHNGWKTNRHAYTLMDHIHGCDLFEYVYETYYDDDTKNKGKINNIIEENDIKIFTKKILEAIEYIHQKGIIHRDLKPENILLVNKNIQDPRIIDFGLATLLTNKEELRRMVGSLHYVAPEIVNGEEYDEKVDIWSIGIIVYVMLCGSFPFSVEAKDINDFAVKISCFECDFDRIKSLVPWKNRSAESKSFVKFILQNDKNQRPSAQLLLQHSWFK